MQKTSCFVPHSLMEGATVIQAKNQNKKEEVGVQGIQHATEQLFNSSQNIRFLSISQLSVNKKEESENKCTTFQNLNFFLITEYSTDTKRHKIIFLCHSTKAGSFRLETLHIKRYTVPQTTYRGLFVNWLYNKLLVIERDVSYFTPRKTNLGCQPSKRKSSH